MDDHDRFTHEPTGICTISRRLRLFDIHTEQYNTRTVLTKGKRIEQSGQYSHSSCSPTEVLYCERVNDGDFGKGERH